MTGAEILGFLRVVAGADADAAYARFVARGPPAGRVAAYRQAWLVVGPEAGRHGLARRRLSSLDAVERAVLALRIGRRFSWREIGEVLALDATALAARVGSLVHRFAENAKGRAWRPLGTASG